MAKKSNKAHAELSASGASRWLNCPASVKLCRDLPPLPKTKYAIEGTKAHKLLELWLDHLIASPYTAFPIPKGYPKLMVSAVRVAVDEVKKMWAKGKAGELESETRISLEHIGEDMFGTTDWRITEHYGRLRIWDYKHGYHPVEVRKDKKMPFNINPQLIYYSLGSAHEHNYDFEDVEIGIVQPRAIHHEGPSRSVIITLDELRSYEDLFRKGVDRVFSPHAKTFAGDWCKFCAAQESCKAFKKYVSREAAKAFADIDFED